ncbi:hypothetical protein [Terrabacter terrigena]|uniref:DUF664 domain-containing protein n=1 Tax=Terrabacter terrigena TaxID=574718 RepID=A0ABW3MYY1_9MICO
MTEPANFVSPAVIDDPAPADSYEAAAWLRERHPWLDELLTRVVGPTDLRIGRSAWLDELVDAFTELVEHGSDWRAYKAANPEPRESDDWEESERTYAAWSHAGPQLRTGIAQSIAPMSSGEVRILRLLTTLGTGNRVAAGWRVDDIAYDDRGAAVVEDWIAVVRAQLPALRVDPPVRRRSWSPTE